MSILDQNTAVTTTQTASEVANVATSSAPDPDTETQVFQFDEAPNHECPEFVYQVLGDVRKDASSGAWFCTCPGQANHTGKNGPKDCRLYLEPTPHIHCFHQNCSAEVKTANARLTGFARSSDTHADKKARSALEKIMRLRSEELARISRRARYVRDYLLREFQWPYNAIKGASPVAIPPDDHAAQCRMLIECFESGDTIWVGELTASGQLRHGAYFRTREEWIANCTPPPAPFICPATFRSGSHSRSNASLDTRRFLVVESDTLDRDRVGGIFRFLRDNVGLPLIAVVNTGGKSLHGWFRYPDEKTLQELKAILPQLGCDPKMFTASQPARLPGFPRGRGYQELVYCDPAAATTGDIRSLEIALPLPELYYTGSRGLFYTQTETGWTEVSQALAENILVDAGVSKNPLNGEPLPETKRAIIQLVKDKALDYAAPVAGYPVGLHAVLGRKILVTRESRPVEAKAGDFPLIRDIFQQLFGECQQAYVYGWLKIRYESLLNRRWHYGQVLALCGPRNSGKSLFQALLTEFFGGTSANPYPFMTGVTAFNSDWFAATHLMVEDAAESTNYAIRRRLASYIKQIAVNKKQNCSQKYRDSVTLMPIWAATISLNDEPTCLQVLPPIDEDVRDKIMLLKVSHCNMPMPTETADQKAAFWNALVAELPSLADYLLKYQIPDEIRCERFNVTHYHHPDLLQGLGEIAPATTLIEIIDAVLFAEHSNGFSALDGPARPLSTWEGTAPELQARLTENTSYGSVARQLLPHPNACGQLLGQLEREECRRVKRKRTAQKRLWIIEPPAEL